ncbi:glycosyltransferase family 9 protein [soil metagenome]
MRSSIASGHTARYRPDMTAKSEGLEASSESASESLSKAEKPADGPVLFIRMDRIGDLVLSLAADSVFESPVDWWIAPNTGFIADHAAPRRRVREMKIKIQYSEFKHLLRELKSRAYKTAILFHAPWWVSPLLWLARIPNRVGVKSQWHTFLFLNKGVRQKRSLAEVSEYEYNLRLVEAGLGLAEGEASREPLHLGIDPKWQEETLGDHGLALRKYSVVHPGMSGSARNWPTSHYISWIQEAAQTEKIVITGTASDEPILEPIRQALAGTQNVVWLEGKLSGPMLLHILAGARVVLAPSTGVVHLAASLGRPVIGIYSPVKVQHPRRWGPLGEAVQVLVPDVECPGKKACLGAQCPQYDCMNRISLESVRSLWSAAEA